MRTYTDSNNSLNAFLMAAGDAPMALLDWIVLGGILLFIVCATVGIYWALHRLACRWLHWMKPSSQRRAPRGAMVRRLLIGDFKTAKALGVKVGALLE